MVIYSSPIQPLSNVYNRFIVGVTFTISCLFGISLALYPNWFRQKKKGEILKKHADTLKRQVKGHHPECTTFQTHTIHFHQKIWCAGCLGLSIGSALAIVFMILYVLFPWNPSTTLERFIFILGFLIILFVFLEISRQIRSAILHVFLNSLLPFSFFLITISIGEITGNMVYGIFSVLLCFLWLDTRIRLSKWNHHRTCTFCPETCKYY